MRALRIGLLLLVAMLALVGCGEDDDSGRRDDGSGRDDVAVFDASRVPYGEEAVIVRLDAARLDATFDVLRRVTGVRAAEDSLPTRDDVLHAALAAVGIDVPADAEFGDWIGDEAGATNTARGRIAWVRIRSGQAKAARRFVTRADGVATRIDGDTVLLAADDAALDLDIEDDRSLAAHRRWEQLEDARSRSGASVAATDGDVIAIAGSDDHGLWLDGVGSGDDTCAQASGDRLDELERLPVGTTFGAAPVAPDQLAAFVARGLALVEPLRAEVPDDGAVARVLAGVDRAIAATQAALVAGGTDRGIVGLRDVGTAKPARVVTDEEEAAGALAADPGYSAVRQLVDVDEPVTFAMWVDPLRIVRALGTTQLDGVEGAVVGSLGDGIDGVLAWRTCRDRIGARVAIAD